VKLRFKGSTLHARAQMNIPWLANGSLPADAEPALREHISTCPECRQDYAEQLRVCETMRAEGPLVFAAESSYQKLLTRIRASAVTDDEERAHGPRPRLGRPQLTQSFRRATPLVQGLAAAVILQTVAIGLGAWAWHSRDGTNSTRYMTLTSPSPSYESGPRVRIVFRSELSLEALQSLLRGAGARIIDGPADGDVYTLGFVQPPASPAALEKRIAALRASPEVLFAEPVQNGVP
jgi:hypothetical protein